MKHVLLVAGFLFPSLAGANSLSCQFDCGQVTRAHQLMLSSTHQLLIDYVRSPSNRWQADRFRGVEVSGDSVWQGLRTILISDSSLRQLVVDESIEYSRSDAGVAACELMTDGRVFYKGHLFSNERSYVGVVCTVTADDE